MASKPITINLQPRGKPIKTLPKTVTTYLQSSTSDLHHRIAAEAHFDPHRLRLTTGDANTLVPNAKDTTIDRAGLKNDATVFVKDLGPQIDWQTVFVIEYLGPLMIHAIWYMLSSRFSAHRPSTAQSLSSLMICTHFAKRLYETLYIHRFSNATMPMRNIFKNSAHYWIFAGANIAFWTYGANTGAARLNNPIVIGAALVVFVIGEVGNLITHIDLRNLRSAGGTERQIPKGLGFDTVTCPNYTFETIAWVGMWFMTWSLSTGVFVVIAVAQMAVWARKKEARYRKEFGPKYAKKRFAMLPGIV